MTRLTVCALLTLVFSGQALAQGTVAAKVIGIRIDQSGIGMVIFDQSIGGQPTSCRHSAYTNALAFDSNTPAGRKIVALALAAKTTGDTISAIGTGTCSIFSGNWVEDWSYGISQ